MSLLLTLEVLICSFIVDFEHVFAYWLYLLGVFKTLPNILYGAFLQK